MSLGLGNEQPVGFRKVPSGPLLDPEIERQRYKARLASFLRSEVVNGKEAISKRRKRDLFGWRPEHLRGRRHQAYRQTYFKECLNILSQTTIEMARDSSKRDRRKEMVHIHAQSRDTRPVCTDESDSSRSVREKEMSGDRHEQRRLHQSQDDYPLTVESHTEDRFLTLVKNIVNANRSQALYKSHGQRNGQMIPPTTREKYEAIVQLFSDPSVRGIVTSGALNVALLYFHTHQAGKYATKLYERLSYLFTELPDSTYNTQLRFYASVKDDVRFWESLVRFRKSGFRPDAQTWISLLMSRESTKDKLVVAKAMRALGISKELWVQRDIANQLCLAEYHAFDWDNGTLLKFFAHMRERYGSRWLSPSAGNILFAELLQPEDSPRTKALVHGLEALDEAKDYGFLANNTTLDIFLKAGSSTGRGDLLIEILRLFRLRYGRRPDKQAHTRLFKYAWRLRKPNFLIVIWISACLQGFPSANMWNYMTNCLDNDWATNPPISTTDRFRERVCLLLASVNVEGMVPNLEALQSGNARINSSHQLLRAHHTIFGKVKLKYNLEDSLAQALQSDGFWIEQDQPANLVSDRGDMQAVRGQNTA